jgi:DNA-binding PadR family transcriptional regulator
MDDSNHLPLQEPTFFILLSLAPGKKHGYAILKDVESLSHGRHRLGTGTLYGALSRLLEQGLIERTTDGGQPGPGRARKAYALTRAGRLVLQGETARMQALVSAARARLGEEPA